MTYYTNLQYHMNVFQNDGSFYLGNLEYDQWPMETLITPKILFIALLHCNW